jgi:hypothetical protein
MNVPTSAPAATAIAALVQASRPNCTCITAVT